MQVKLHLFDRDGALLTYFHTALTAEAFVLIHGFRLSVNQFININGAHIYAFGIASALVLVDRNFKHLFSSVVT